MSKQIAKNTFTSGLLMDLHPLSSLNTLLTNALNATLVTIDGDEMILQNDLGNLKIRDLKTGEEDYVQLTPGFIPVGMKSHNGIAYIVSYNPTTGLGEIGTFPSPNYPLHTLSESESDDDPFTPDPSYPIANRVKLSDDSNISWATWDMGATSEDSLGGYYGWGDPTGEESSRDLSKYGGGLNINISGTEYDIAKAKWGKDWRLPTKEEFEELYTYTWEDLGTRFKITGTNGNYIYLNKGGYKNPYRVDGVLHPNDSFYWIGDISDVMSSIAPYNYPYISLAFSSSQLKEITTGAYRIYQAFIKPVYIGTESDTPEDPSESSNNEITVLSRDINSSDSDYNLYKDLINSYKPLYNLYRGSVKVGNKWYTLDSKLDLPIEYILHPLRSVFFGFDLEHPVDIEIQPSYDGSVNLILNDGLNIPRLINSRFSVLENGTWEIPKRRRNNDNIYRVNYKTVVVEQEEGKIRDSYLAESIKGDGPLSYDEAEIRITEDAEGCERVSVLLTKENYEAAKSIFDITTSLNKRISIFPVIKFNGVVGSGNLPVGNYVLYFKYCDEDGNETDFIGQSSIISIFKGKDNDPFSIDGGVRDMDSNKSIDITLNHIDSAYNFVKVYYTRTSADADENRAAVAYKVTKTYPIYNDDDDNTKSYCHIVLNGDEEKETITVEELNERYYIVNSAETQAQSNNMLFLGNINTADLHYKDLTDLSLRIIPYVTRTISKNKIGLVNQSNYKDFTNLEDEKKHLWSGEYYNTKNIYYNTGYWNEEFYRLGIVYIYEDNSLSPVFNILGYCTKGLLNEEGKPYYGVIESPKNRENEADNSCDYDISKDHITEIFHVKQQGEETARKVAFTKIPPIYDENKRRYYIDLEPADPYSFSHKGRSDFECTNYINQNTLNAGGVILILDDEKTDTFPHKIENAEDLGRVHADSFNRNYADFYYRADNKDPKKLAEQYIYNLGVYINQDIICYLKNELKIKGFFIVRQKRIPTILAQAYTMPWDKEAKVPIVEYWDFRWDTKIDNLQLARWKSNTLVESGSNFFPNYISSTNTSGRSTDYFSLSRKGKYFFPLYKRRYFVESFMLQASEDAFQLYDIVENEQDYNQNERKRSIEHKYRPRLFDIDRSTIDYPMFWTSKLAEDNPLNIPNIKVEFSISLNKNITSGIMEGDQTDYGSCTSCKTDDCKTNANYRPYNSNFNDTLFYYIQYKEEKDYSGTSIVPPMVYPNTNFISGFSEKPYACTGKMKANGTQVYYRLSDSNNETIEEGLLNEFNLEGFGLTDLEGCHTETYYYAGESLPEKYKNYVYLISDEESGEYELIDDGWYSSPKSAINAYLTLRNPSDTNNYYNVWVAIAFLNPNERMVNGIIHLEDGKTYNVVPTRKIISNLNVKGDEGEDNSLYSYENLTSINDYEAGYVVEGSSPSKERRSDDDLRRCDDNFATYYLGNFTENTDGCIVTAKNLVNSITDGRSGTRGRMYRWIRSYYLNRMLDDTDDLDHMASNANGLASANGATIRHFYDLYKYCNGNQFTAICPEFEIKQSLYNQLFTGASYKIKYTPYQQGIFLRNFSNERLYYTGYPSMLNNGGSWYTAKIGDIEWDLEGKGGVHYNYLEYPKRTTVEQKSELDWNKGKGRECKIVAVTDSVPVVAIDNYIYRGVCGDAAEAYRFEYITEEHCPKRMFKEVESGAFDDDELWANLENIHDFNMVRGLFSPYLGMSLVKEDDEEEFPEAETERNRQYGQTINIYNELAENTYDDNLKLRFRDTSPFYTVSERISFDNLRENLKGGTSDRVMKVYEPNPIYESDLVYVKKKNEKDFDPGVYLDIFRGDCYLCTFTHRLNRNFQDPSAPSNDKIVDPKTWMRNYDPDKGTEQLEKINRGDVNAVKLGSWLTIKVRASYNLSIRSLDERYTTESATMGRARGFYPLQLASAEGGYKIPESAVLNDGFGSTVGERWYNILPNAPYYNSNFNYRILYSDVNVLDSYKNGYRTFRYGNMQDYTKQYGLIVKLVEWYGDLICVFEHGVALLPVNERALAATGSGGEVFINNSNVLPDALNAIISDKFGSQWADSIIKTPYYVYGVDASTKKIWRTNGKTLQILSDMKVEKFLKENIPLAENDSTPYIGIKNIKTHYNQTKSDVMFTFYTRNPNNEEDEIAWNLCLNEIGGNSEGESGHFVTFYSWIPLFSATINNRWYSFDREAFRGQILSKNKCCEVGASYWEYAKGLELENCCPQPTDLYILDAEKKKKEKGIYLLLIPPFLWEHNNAHRRPLPTHWYGKQHPFEFEFVVLEDGSIHKIFENLLIISNKAEPESFHYEVTGEVYEFHEDKPNIFFRQEFLKNVYANMGSHWTYDPEAYSRVHPNQKAKSTIFPLYYMRKDEYDLIYDNYQRMTSDHWDYQNLSGTEVFWNKRDHEFDLCTHIKNLPITGHWERCSKEEWERIYNLYKGCDDLILRSKLKKEVKPVEAFTFDTLAFVGGECKEIVKTDVPSNIWYYKWVEGGRLRGNTHYKEDKWNVLIPSITFMLRNEPEWPKATEVVREKGEKYEIEYQKTMGRYHNPNIANTEEISVPPMVLDLAHIPNDLDATVINWETLPNTFSQGQQRLNVLYDGSLSNYISPSLKWTNRKETKIRDKYCKIKVRYSGEELAIISAILTTFNTSIA